jgi:hypothetical protein
MDAIAGVVDMDADIVRQVWLRADRIRERELRTPDLTDLVDIASEFGAVDWKLVSDLSVLLDRRLGDVAPPRVVLEFINELSRRLNPGRVLDPFVVNPAVLVSAVDTPSRPTGTGVVRVDRAAELGERLAPDVDWQREDPILASAAQWDARYDLIVSAPPFGSRVDTSLLREGEPRTLTSDTGDLVLFRALLRLGPSGVALVQVSNSYFWKESRLKTRRALESSGYHLSGVFSISGPGISISAIVLTRIPVDSLFVGRLKEVASVATLVENFLSRRPGDVFELGRLVPVDKYSGWEQHAILSAWGGTAAPIRLGDIATLKMRSIAAGETLSPGENTVYIPTVGTGPVTTVSPSYVGNGKYRVLEAALDSDRARADYVAEWLSSVAGVAARRAFTTGSTISHVTAAGAASVPIDLPSIDLQDRVTRAAQRLHSMQAKVLQLRESLWSNPLAVWPTVASELTRAAGADPLLASVDGLPYPLASVLHRYIAESAIDRKVSRLVQYFEVTAEFSAILLLSAFRRDAALFGSVQQELTKNDPEKRHLSLLDRTDFGQWINLGFTLAKAARRAVGDKALLAPLWSQAVGPASEVATLLSTVDYWRLLDQARPIRNERAHGGIDSDTQSKAWLRQLEGMLNELVRVTGPVWEKVRLLLPDIASLRSGVWTYLKAKLLVGSNDIFREVEFTSLEPIEAGQLVFAAQGQGHEILPVVPLVRLSTPGTHGRIACYFFSARDGRDKFKYVSYHYEDEPQKTFTDASVGDLIRLLMPPNDGLGN